MIVALMTMQVTLPLTIWDTMPKKIAGCILMGKQREKAIQELHRTNVKWQKSNYSDRHLDRMIDEEIS
jgi:hypothetical protein